MSDNKLNRRKFLAGTAAALSLSGLGSIARAANKRDFKIAVDGWSLHKEVFSGKIKSLDCFRLMREEFDIGAFNLVNNMLEVVTHDYTMKLKREAKKYDVEIPLIMIDSEAALGDRRKEMRDKSVRDHKKWIWMASDLGCHSIRVNWRGEDAAAKKSAEGREDFLDRSAEAFAELCAVGEENGISVIIENHGGLSSDPDAMSALMKKVDSKYFGTLPDFGNFDADTEPHDAIDKLMPYAKAVSAKCWGFDDESMVTSGRGHNIDFERMMEIVHDKHGYSGWVGIEFEGAIPEREGSAQAKTKLVQIQKG